MATAKKVQAKPAKAAVKAPAKAKGSAKAPVKAAANLPKQSKGGGRPRPRPYVGHSAVAKAPASQSPG